MAKRVYHGSTRGSFTALADDLKSFYGGKIDKAMEAGTDAAHDATFEGYLAMLRIIEESVTGTGEARAGRGGHPGRIDSGAMHDAVNANTWVKPGGESAGGTWGWIDGFEDYFLYQEKGADEFNVAFRGMQALNGSYVIAREDFLRRLQDAGFKVN